MSHAPVSRPVTADPAVRHRLARLLGRYFLAHLDEELGKSPRVLDVVAFEGRTARDVTTEERRRLLERFPDLPSLPAPGWNLFRRWAEVDGQVAYDEFSFEAYHRIFLARLEDLDEGTEESRRRLLNVTWSVFGAYDYRARGFSVTFFLDSENNMRELLRRIAGEDKALDGEASWLLLNDQSRAYQMTVYRFFEALLRRAYAENEALLDNVLPRPVQEELKRTGRAAPVTHPRVAVLFSDFAGFTDRTARTPPEDLVGDLNRIFTAFDEIMARHGCERVKTIGDAYLAVCGMPEPSPEPVAPLLAAAFEVVDWLRGFQGAGAEPWRARVGLHVGPVIAAVVGVRKYIYDVFGDTVNTAARMEQLCEPMHVHVTEAVAAAAPRAALFEPRPPIDVKGKGRLVTYYARPPATG